MSVFEICIIFIFTVCSILFLVLEIQFNKRIVDIRSAAYKAILGLNQSVHRLFLLINSFDVSVIKIDDSKAGESSDSDNSDIG